MLRFPEIDPVAFEIGPLAVHWYGLMYLVGFAGGWWLGMVRAKRPDSGWVPEQVTDALFYVALGVVLGGRIGYVLFYASDELFADPLVLLRLWEGGMSFHGGFLGVLLGMWWFTRKYGKKFFDVMDFVAPLATIGLGAGRLGNFFNGELWGRVSDAPWAMVFPGAGALPRHPSQLYEFLLEGVALFIILWTFSAKPRPRMAVSGLFSLCYGVFRFGVEFFRQPDAHMGDSGFIAFGWLTTGQLLSAPMILVGAALLWWAYQNKPASGNAAINS
ncbi:MAG: prolipoprotein diacylglyceryl transferase [Gammaproteobacteria bacterium SG8_11]|nr:MAG: prolipoprotein diacylglyceryl transferase [Gammaproteobacteria bacterium SG8_11]